MLTGTRTFRVFVSSELEDLQAERGGLQRELSSETAAAITREEPIR